MAEPSVTVSGDENGWIVEVHDGDRCEAFGVMAHDADAAMQEGLRRFRAPLPVVDP